MITDSAIQPVGVFAQFAQDIQTALYTIPGVVNRGTNKAGQSIGDVFLGHWEFFAKQNFYKELAHQKFEFFIGSPKGNARLIPPNAYYGDHVSVVEMLYCIPADEPFSLIPVMQMLAAVSVALSTAMQKWGAGANRQPTHFEFGEPEYKFHEKPTVVTTKFAVYGGFISDQAVLPILVPAVTGN